MDIINWESYLDQQEWTLVRETTNLSNLCCYLNQEHKLSRGDVVLNEFVEFDYYPGHKICTKCYQKKHKIQPAKFCPCYFLVGCFLHKFLAPNNWIYKDVTRTYNVLCCRNNHANGNETVKGIFCALTCKFHSYCIPCHVRQMTEQLDKDCECPFVLFSTNGDEGQRMVHIQ